MKWVGIFFLFFFNCTSFPDAKLQSFTQWVQKNPDSITSQQNQPQIHNLHLQVHKTHLLIKTLTCKYTKPKNPLLKILKFCQNKTSIKHQTSQDLMVEANALIAPHLLGMYVRNLNPPCIIKLMERGEWSFKKNNDEAKAQLGIVTVVEDDDEAGVGFVSVECQREWDARDSAPSSSCPK